MWLEGSAEARQRASLPESSSGRVVGVHEVCARRGEGGEGKWLLGIHTDPQACGCTACVDMQSQPVDAARCCVVACDWYSEVHFESNVSIGDSSACMQGRPAAVERVGTGRVYVGVGDTEEAMVAAGLPLECGSEMTRRPWPKVVGWIRRSSVACLAASVPTVGAMKNVICGGTGITSKSNGLKAQSARRRHVYPRAPRPRCVKL